MTEPANSPYDPANSSGSAAPTRDARHNKASLLLAGLTPALVVGVFLVGEQLNATPFSRTWYSQNWTYIVPEPPIQRLLTVILVGAAFLPFLGLALAAPGGLRRTRSSVAGFVGLATNSLLAIVTALILVFAFWNQVVLANVHGVFLINGDLPPDSIIYLKSPEGMTRMTDVSANGSYAFHGLEPGHYGLTAASRVSQTTTCVDISAENSFEILSPSSAAYRLGVWVSDPNVKVPSGPFKAVTLDIRLVCD